MGVQETFYTIPHKSVVQKIANSQVTGVKVDLTQMAVGDGNGAYTIQQIQQQLQKMKCGNIGSIDVDSVNTNWIVIETIIPASRRRFSVREVGLFDVEGDLIAVGKYPETYKPVLENGSAKDLFIRMIIEVSNAAAVTLKMDQPDNCFKEIWMTRS
ncbi:phage tail protein [Anaerobacillus sp. HL2]|nr:phage tail protein [Anaerobacillus sp. HL2]